MTHSEHYDANDQTTWTRDDFLLRDDEQGDDITEMASNTEMPTYNTPDAVDRFTPPEENE